MIYWKNLKMTFSARFGKKERLVEYQIKTNKITNIRPILD